MNNYLRLLKFLKPHLGLLLSAVACMAVSTLFNGASLGLLAPIADRVLGQSKIVVSSPYMPRALYGLIDYINAIPRHDLLRVIAIAVSVLFLLKGLFLFLQSYLMNKLSMSVIKDLRDKLFTKIQNLSLDYFADTKIGELVSRITYDVSLVQNSITEGLTDLVYQSFQIAIFIGIVFMINYRLALVIFIVFPIIAFLIFKVGRLIRKMTTHLQVVIGNMNTIMIEAISGIKIVQSFTMEHYEIKRFMEKNTQFFKMSLKLAKRMVLLSQVTEYLGVLAGVVVFLIGGKEVISGKLSSGVFILFLGALLSLIRPFKRLSQVHSINQQAASAASRIFTLLDKEPTVRERPGAVGLKAFEKEINFEKVWFKYEDRMVLEGVDVAVQKSHVVAFVGPSGAGKTTLVSLLPRFYDPNQGRITIDGKDLREFDLQSLRQRVSMVTQESTLFHDTIKANLLYGNPGARDEEVIAAAKKAQAHEVIARLPSGYDTLIGDRGIKLSGGERQRICIARAILKNAPILILDEATSQLDTESERLVQKAIENLMEGRTVLVIAHRLSTIIRADMIVVLEAGKIVGRGTHEELLGNCPIYKYLYELQFEKV